MITYYYACPTCGKVWIVEIIEKDCQLNWYSYRALDGWYQAFLNLTGMLKVACVCEDEYKDPVIWFTVSELIQGIKEASNATQV